MDRENSKITTVLLVFQEQVHSPTEFSTFPLGIKWSKTRKVHYWGTVLVVLMAKGFGISLYFCQKVFTFRQAFTHVST